MKYKNFTLDEFQVDAIKSIENGHSVVVSAATGTGKTLIADYIIDKYLKQGRRIIYTAPIKALSSQKFRDFRKEYGEDKIGLMTGDIVINPEAPVIIMTTEIYRNMLITNDPSIDHVSYVIFDEIHFINDIERGTIWEESIIFSPPHVRFLCLSATIPNKHEFADWIQSIKEHQIDVVENAIRAVPLSHHIYTNDGMTTVSKLLKGPKKRKRNYKKEEMPNHVELVEELHQKKWLPAIYFNFSRRMCEQKAKELSKKIDFLDQGDKRIVLEHISRLVPQNLKVLSSFTLLKKALIKGVAFHHAGLLPKFKELVEVLFGMGIIRVLYATETFAVGINMPAKTVCFNGLMKFDGVNTRYLNSKEYFQLAGRAGRRGIDKCGNAIAAIDPTTNDLHRIKRFTSKDVDPIISQFKLSINTVLNMVYYHKDEDAIKTILKSNFDHYLKTQKGTKTNILNSYNNKVKLLKKLEFIDEKNILTDKGIFARHIYSNEIIVGELFSRPDIMQLDEKELLALVGSIVYEPKRSNRFKLPKKYKNHLKIYNKLSDINYFSKECNLTHLAWMDFLITHWVDHYNISELMKLCNFQEGDIIRLFRLIIDMIRQIRKANSSAKLDENLTKAINLINQDVIKVDF